MTSDAERVKLPDVLVDDSGKVWVDDWDAIEAALPLVDCSYPGTRGRGDAWLKSYKDEFLAALVKLRDKVKVPLTPDHPAWDVWEKVVEDCQPDEQIWNADGKGSYTTEKGPWYPNPGLYRAQPCEDLCDDGRVDVTADDIVLGQYDTTEDCPTCDGHGARYERVKE